MFYRSTEEFKKFTSVTKSITKTEKLVSTTPHPLITLSNPVKFISDNAESLVKLSSVQFAEFPKVSFAVRRKYGAKAMIYAIYFDFFAVDIPENTAVSNNNNIYTVIDVVVSNAMLRSMFCYLLTVNLSQSMAFKINARDDINITYYIVER